ncbi:MAG: glycosyltransferase family 39 protein, partial [Lachnospiraceae bacterium]|nr:glycosyltransferase family 39 protein [Lachnospiraceae bacterium]
MKNDFRKASRWIFLGVPLVAGMIVYMMNLTQSALWYDEAIEYFFSKYTSGAVPGSRYTSSMYERIVSTYQPPLYNWLMHLWLLFFDSEYSFRLAGVLITLLGTIGIFAGLSELTDYRWASLGSLLYVFTGSISYYALECAEYNLMLCCIAWTLYFYIKTILTDRVHSLVFFFIFACLSVYSQYGAVFLVVVLYLSFFTHFVYNKKKEMIKLLIILTAIVLVIAVMPLVWFFLLTQLQHQGTTSVSHSVYFANDRNVAVDFIVSVLSQLGFNFGGKGDLPQIARRLPTIVVAVAIIATIIAGLRKKKMLNNLVGVCIVSWLIYYIITACSLYGYNSWNAESLGTNNIGKSYGLFFTPLWVLTLTYGIYLFSIIVKEKVSKNIWMGYRVLFTIAVFIFCGVGMVSVYKLSKKDN